MTLPRMWQVPVAPEQEGSTEHQQWSVLWPEVSELGEVTAWTRIPCTSAEDAWDRVLDAARASVALRVEVRRVTVEVDAWYTPPRPTLTGPDGE